MQTFAQCIDLVDDPRRIAEYEEWHRHVYPEVLAALRTIGIRSMKIFRHGTRLFMVCEAVDGFDPARDYQRYAVDPKCREWDERMRTYQRPVAASNSGVADWWATMRPIFEWKK